MQTLALHNDQAVIEAVKNGSYSAFERIFRSHYGPLCAFAMGYLKDRDATEEAVQQVFYIVWERRESINITTSFKAYLYQAVRNHCLNALKHEQVKASAHGELLREDEPEEENNLESIELRERIDQAISELPTERQKIFRMSRFEELKYKEIAEKLQISVKTVENQMGKALKHLRESLSELMPLLLWLFVNIFKGE